MASKTFLIIPQEGHGHLNACQSVASQLAELGHRVIVAFEQAWRPVAEKLDGRLAFVFYVDPTRPPNLAPNEFWLDHMERSCNTFGLDPMEEMDMEKVEDPNQDPYASSLYSMLNIDKAVGEVIAQVQPDVIVLDTYKIMPAVVNCGRPWVWLTSAGPLSCLGSPLLPPSGTGKFDTTIYSVLSLLSRPSRLLVLEDQTKQHGNVEHHMHVGHRVDQLSIVETEAFVLAADVGADGLELVRRLQKY